MGRSQLCSTSRGSSGSTPGTFCSQLRVSKGRGQKIQHLHNMSFLIVTKLSWHEGRTRGKKRGAGNKVSGKLSRRESMKYGGNSEEKMGIEWVDE